VLTLTSQLMAPDWHKLSTAKSKSKSDSKPELSPKPKPQVASSKRRRTTGRWKLSRPLAAAPQAR